VLTDQPTQRVASNYWAKLKKRFNAESANELLTNCQQLKLTAKDKFAESGLSTNSSSSPVLIG